MPSRRGRRSERTVLSHVIRLVLRPRTLVIVPLAVLAAWLSIATTGSAVLRRVNPEIAIKLAPYDALSRASQAEILVGSNPTAANLDRATELAKAALERDPTVASAWRTLALVAGNAGEAEEATRLMTFAGRMSRRDFPTQLWLIEDNVRRNDVLGALQHYDYALRTSRNAIDLLLPILVSSVAEDSLVEPVADLLTTRPPWLPQFFYVFGQGAPATANSAELIELLRRKGYEDPIPNAQALPARLVNQGEYQAAGRAHLALQAGQVELPNDEFGKTPRTPPFDWDLPSGSGIRSEPELLDEADKRAALYVFGDQGISGTAASKLLMLAPGAYRLSTVVGGSDGGVPERLRWTLDCVSPNGQLGELDVTPTKSASRRYTMAFRVPASGGCPAQWLRLQIRSADGPTPSEAYVYALEIEPQRR